MPAKTLDPDVSDIAALAAFLKTGKARKAFHAALKKGASPTVSLTAAISASLVSAAAKEDAFDPLAGLAAVDDLSAFGEVCLPGSNYEADEEHDHDSLSGSGLHEGHGGYASYLADPFASRFANVYARDHDGHDNHDAHDAMASNHSSHSAHDGEGSHGAQHAAGHSGHQQGHHSHQHHDVAAPEPHAHDDAHASGQHSEAGAHSGAHAGEIQHDAHSAHDGGHDMAAHTGEGHAEGHAHQASVESAHTDHASLNDVHEEPANLEGDVNDLDQGIEALAEHHHDTHESVTPVSDDATDTPAEEAHHNHHNHGVTLADMDSAPADDLAAATPPPVI